MQTQQPEATCLQEQGGAEPVSCGQADLKVIVCLKGLFIFVLFCFCSENTPHSQQFPASNLTAGGWGGGGDGMGEGDTDVSRPAQMRQFSEYQAKTQLSQ